MKWQVWVGRRRRELQMQLARCLARQGAARRALQRSFGKRAALDQIQTDLTEKTGHITRVKRHEALIALGLLQTKHHCSDAIK